MFTRKPDKEQSVLEIARGSGPPPPPQSAPPQFTPPLSPPMSPPMANAAPPIPRPSTKSQPSQIGADLTIIGNLVSKGEVHIDGEIQGDLHAAQITIGESARVTGGIVADEVVVRGAISGSVRGRRVVLQSTSRVEGDIYHQQLGIEQGAYFEGKSRRLEEAQPVAEVPARNSRVTEFPGVGALAPIPGRE